MVRLVTASLIALAATAHGADAPVRVTADVAAVRPDAVVVVWTFAPGPGWHLYGPHRNDTGQPPSVRWDLPDGWRAGPLEHWPRPERHVVADLILDHVYHDTLTLTQTLERPPDASTRPRRARVRWLACSSICVPGDTALTIPLPGRPSASAAARLAAVRAAAPAPLAVERHHVARPRPDLITVEVSGADRLEFVPAADGPALADLLADGVASGPTLRLRLAAPATVDTLRGLLIVDHDGLTTLGTLAIPLTLEEGDPP